MGGNRPVLPGSGINPGGIPRFGGKIPPAIPSIGGMGGNPGGGMKPDGPIGGIPIAIPGGKPGGIPARIAGGIWKPGGGIDPIPIAL